MKKRDWLLLAIGERIEPIQLQKTLFKFAKESGALQNQVYTFVPYNWGPCSFGIYDDLDMLKAEGLVEMIPTGKGWHVYRLTEAGKRRERDLRKRGNRSLLKKLEAQKLWVTSHSFEQLLRNIYKQYPDFAKESLFRK